MQFGSDKLRLIAVPCQSKVTIPFGSFTRRVSKVSQPILRPEGTLEFAAPSAKPTRDHMSLHKALWMICANIFLYFDYSLLSSFALTQILSKGTITFGH
jgi:hypothetical protein